MEKLLNELIEETINNNELNQSARFDRQNISNEIEAINVKIELLSSQVQELTTAMLMVNRNIERLCDINDLQLRTINRQLKELNTDK